MAWGIYEPPPWVKPGPGGTTSTSGPWVMSSTLGPGGTTSTTGPWGTFSTSGPGGTSSIGVQKAGGISSIDIQKAEQDKLAAERKATEATKGGFFDQGQTNRSNAQVTQAAYSPPAPAPAPAPAPYYASPPPPQYAPPSPPQIITPAIQQQPQENSMWTNVWGTQYNMWGGLNNARKGALETLLGGGDF